MYLPIFRGRQYELLALREVVSANLIGDNIIPIIEPVKVSSTLIKTIRTFIDNRRFIAIILNPCVGSWEKEKVKDGNQYVISDFEELIKSEYVIGCYYVDERIKNVVLGNCILICNKQDSIPLYDSLNSQKILYNLIPDKSDFRRRIRTNRVLLDDHFPKKERNADYCENTDEFFSSDPFYYKDDGYVGFSDYSIIGQDYSETGFAPYAVAIHIVYVKENELRVAHFVSDSNSDTNDTAGKFFEAVEKLVKWNKKANLDTKGIRELVTYFKNESYPGLGTVKKCSIMHHLELMSKSLGEFQ